MRLVLSSVLPGHSPEERKTVPLLSIRISAWDVTAASLPVPSAPRKFPENGKMAKCDLCYIRREYDLKPACVRACPAHALEVGPLEELSKKKAEKASLVILKSLAYSAKDK